MRTPTIALRTSAIAALIILAMPAGAQAAGSHLPAAPNVLGPIGSEVGGVIHVIPDSC